MVVGADGGTPFSLALGLPPLITRNTAKAMMIRLKMGGCGFPDRWLGLQRLGLQPGRHGVRRRYCLHCWIQRTRPGNCRLYCVFIMNGNTICRYLYPVLRSPFSRRTSRSRWLPGNTSLSWHDTTIFPREIFFPKHPANVLLPSGDLTGGLLGRGGQRTGVVLFEVRRTAAPSGLGGGVRPLTAVGRTLLKGRFTSPWGFAAQSSRRVGPCGAG